MVHGGVGMVFCSGYKGGVGMEVADDGGGQVLG